MDTVVRQGFPQDFGAPGGAIWDADLWDAESANHTGHAGDPFLYLRPDACAACARILAAITAPQG